MLVVALEGLARLDEVDEDRLLGSFTSNLGRFKDCAPPLTSELGVVLPQDAKHTICNRKER